MASSACTGFVAVSATEPDELERAVAAIEQAAIQASCETRRLWGQQTQAFAASGVTAVPTSVTLIRRPGDSWACGLELHGGRTPP